MQAKEINVISGEETNIELVPHKGAGDGVIFIKSGEAVPEGFSKLSDADLFAITSIQAKIDKWNAIKSERERRKVGGVKVKVGTVDKWFRSDDASRIQQMGLVMMGASIPANLQWKTMDGSFVTMTQAVAGAVFAAAATSDQAIFAVAEGHRAAMEASADPSVYDYSTGWPKVYGE